MNSRVKSNLITDMNMKPTVSREQQFCGEISNDVGGSGKLLFNNVLRRLLGLVLKLRDFYILFWKIIQMY